MTGGIVLEPAPRGLLTKTLDGQVPACATYPADVLERRVVARKEVRIY